MNLRTFAVESCCIIFLNTAAEWLALRLGPRCIESPWPGPTAQIQHLIARMKEFKPGCRLKLWVSKLTDPKWLPINMVYNVWSMIVEKWRYIPFTLPIQRKLPKKSSQRWELGVYSMQKIQSRYVIVCKCHPIVCLCTRWMCIISSFCIFNVQKVQLQKGHLNSAAPLLSCAYGQALRACNRLVRAWWPQGWWGCRTPAVLVW